LAFFIFQGGRSALNYFQSQTSEIKSQKFPYRRLFYATSCPENNPVKQRSTVVEGGMQKYRSSGLDAYSNNSC